MIKSINLSVFFPYIKKSCKTILFLIILDKTNILQIANYYQLSMKFRNVLIVAQREILMGFSSIFQMFLLRFDMNIYFFEIIKYFTTHQQRDVLNVPSSSWKNVPSVFYKICFKNPITK